jgi:hypothetical protein
MRAGVEVTFDKAALIEPAAPITVSSASEEEPQIAGRDFAANHGDRIVDLCRVRNVATRACMSPR